MQAVPGGATGASRRSGGAGGAAGTGAAGPAAREVTGLDGGAAGRERRAQLVFDLGDLQRLHAALFAPHALVRLGVRAALAEA
jgi:hypothetical protein